MRLSPNSSCYSLALSLVLSVTFQHVFGQQTDAPSDEQWKTELPMDGVRILSKKTDCSDRANGIFNEYVLLQVMNTNDYSVEVAFDRLAWFDGVCNNCKAPSPENRTIIVISGESVAKGECASKDKSMKVFSKKLDMPEVAKLTRFELGRPTITPLSHRK